MRISRVTAIATTIVLGVVTGALASPAYAEPAVVIQHDEVWSPPDGADAVQEEPSDEEILAQLLEELADPADSRSASEPEGDVTASRAPAGTPAGAPGLGEMPWFAFESFELAGDATAQVNLANGNLLLKANDLAIAGPGFALRQDRFYNGLSDEEGTLGGGWSSNSATDIALEYSTNHPSIVTFRGPNGMVFDFTLQADGSWKAPAGYNFSLRDRPLASGLRDFRVVDNKSNDEWRFLHRLLLNGRNGDEVGVRFYSTNATDGRRMLYVTHDSGRRITFGYPNNVTLRPTSVGDSAGRSVAYGYDSEDRLSTVTSVDGRVTSYEYDSVGRLSSMAVPSSASATTTIFYE